MAEKSIKELADLLWQTKTGIADVNLTLKELKKEQEDYEQRLAAALEAIGMDQVRNDDATFTLSKSVHCHARDWDAVHKWVLETGNLQIFMRRIMDNPFRDLLEIGENIPGTEQYEKTVIKTKTRKPT